MPLLQKGMQMAAGRMPKVIGPNAHAMIDYVVAGSFLIAGALLWSRNKRAALSAFVCGGATAANSLLTDYPGGVSKVLSFRHHGQIDAGLAGVTAALPKLMSFQDQPEARFFSLGALSETAVVGLTDFDYYEQHPWLRGESKRSGVA